MKRVAMMAILMCLIASAVIGCRYEGEVDTDGKAETSALIR